MDDELHDLDDQIHDDLVLATLLAEDGHRDAARRMLDRPRVRLRTVRDRVETVVANAAVERAAEEAIAGPAPEAEVGEEGRVVPLRAVMAALVWLAAALVAVDAPSLEVLGTGTDPSTGVPDRSSIQSTEFAPSDRWAEPRETADNAVSAPAPRRPWAPARAAADDIPSPSEGAEPDERSTDTDGRVLGFGGGLGGLLTGGEQLGELVEIPGSIVDRGVDDGGPVDVREGDDAGEHEEPAGSDEPHGSEVLEDPEDGDGSDDDGDSSGLLRGDDTDDDDGDGSTGSLP